MAHALSRAMMIREPPTPETIDVAGVESEILGCGASRRKGSKQLHFSSSVGMSHRTTTSKNEKCFPGPLEPDMILNLNLGEMRWPPMKPRGLDTALDFAWRALSVKVETQDYMSKLCNSLWACPEKIQNWTTLNGMWQLSW